MHRERVCVWREGEKRETERVHKEMEMKDKDEEIVQELEIKEIISLYNI